LLSAKEFEGILTAEGHEQVNLSKIGSPD